LFAGLKEYKKEQLKTKPIKKLQGQILVKVTLTPSEASNTNTLTQSKKNIENAPKEEKKESKKLTKSGNNQNTSNVYEMSDIHHAAHSGDCDKIKELLQADKEEALFNSKTGRVYFID
jgi:hypothetical protein